MEQLIRTVEYKEYELSITCSHDAKGWMVDKLTVCRENVTMLPYVAEPFFFYPSAEAAEEAALDAARHHVDGVWSSYAGNA